jgi:hemin uptake protein HemP
VSPDPSDPEGRLRASIQSTAPEAATPVIPIERLLGLRREAVLVHKGVHYRLRITSNDKLILTK